MRDVSHQAQGALALGLQPHTKNMFRKFAESISPARDWAGYWEINRWGEPAPVDYRDDEDFWYNLPANFDLIQAIYSVYEWTGDPVYLEDPTFLSFYRHSLTDYVEAWENLATTIRNDILRHGWNKELGAFSCRHSLSARRTKPLSTKYGFTAD